jgi:hypothetical protein
MSRREGKELSTCLPFLDACLTLFSEFCLGFLSWGWCTASGTRSTVAGLLFWLKQNSGLWYYFCDFSWVIMDME